MNYPYQITEGNVDWQTMEHETILNLSFYIVLNSASDLLIGLMRIHLHNIIFMPKTGQKLRFSSKLSNIRRCSNCARKIFKVDPSSVNFQFDEFDKSLNLKYSLTTRKLSFPISWTFHCFSDSCWVCWWLFLIWHSDELWSARSKS